MVVFRVDVVVVVWVTPHTREYLVMMMLVMVIVMVMVVMVVVIPPITMLAMMMTFPTLILDKAKQ